MDLAHVHKWLCAVQPDVASAAIEAAKAAAAAAAQKAVNEQQMQVSPILSL